MVLNPQKGKEKEKKKKSKKKRKKERKKKKKAVLKMIPNTRVPDFNSLQHRPRKCKLL